MKPAFRRICMTMAAAMANPSLSKRARTPNDLVQPPDRRGKLIFSAHLDLSRIRSIKQFSLVWWIYVRLDL
jgi:hypothetical protein